MESSEGFNLNANEAEREGSQLRKRQLGQIQDAPKPPGRSAIFHADDHTVWGTGLMSFATVVVVSPADSEHRS